MDRSRLYLLGAAAAGAVVVVVVLIVLGTGGSSGTSSGTDTTGSGTTATSAASTALSLAGIPQHGDTLGRAAAPVTIQVFEDPQCPYCREWNLGTLPTVVKDYVRTGKVKLVYRGISIIGPNSENGLRANYAAGEQNKLWQMSNELYARQGEENSGWLNDAMIATAAKAAGVNVASLSAASRRLPSPRCGRTPIRRRRNTPLQARLPSSSRHLQGSRPSCSSPPSIRRRSRRRSIRC